MGGHAVKLIGWGTSEDGEDYWVCVNTCHFFLDFIVSNFNMPSI
jgi:hypothetical protein